MPSTFSINRAVFLTSFVPEYQYNCFLIPLLIPKIDDQKCRAFSMTIRVCSFESRRASQMEALIRKFGGEPTVAPSMREIPLEENVIAGEFADQIMRGEIDFVIFMTGVGSKTLFEALQKLNKFDSFFPKLKQATIIVRGPKPFAYLRGQGLEVHYRASEPNTWREILGIIDESGICLTDKKVAVQEYGKPNLEFYEALRKQGAEVLPVPVYRWAFPLDVEPLHCAIKATIANQFDLLLFTSANQLDNILQAAEQLGEQENWLQAARNCVLASIGPTCSERMRELNLPIHLEPTHPKMGHLAREAITFVNQRDENG